ncbi:hypothetical protein PTNB73_07634 [Pyrenophora teres f. teres]|uniref:Uncharacterized protein n=1 Tax=Pyrenophora teres f. teres TaxID=97479 RepID=A0A6S6WIE2_9PLEO|nr:hypothetical protein PTNB85_10337 [Pyrenophora teres f. teres]KAE8832083.1 hypothetical protein HRS9139_06325 [Pyrenophora teres f. teres]KAE8835184.1 hypothetical protein HRS9122_07454 [Pyrenophora teres f. teres]KAE8862080.1 hypothetical protein PTNB73_07634 [Pyrenophora teres f. teres]CAE7208490.1 hypothetical protein PTTW11_09848 [Pyrenophora teres f. teres]
MGMWHEEHSSISAKLDDIKRLQESLDMKYDAKLDIIRDEILSVVHQKPTNSPVTQIAELASLKTKFDILQKEQLECTQQANVVRSLYFPVLRRRWNQIPNADRSSNDWVFDTEKTPFKEWLESKDTTYTLFCITGKAGSGKSTLMKYISEDPRTIQSLEKWASSAKLYTASYFFWNQGFDMQRNQAGLFQSLLYQILKSSPDLIPLVISHRLHHEEWELAELKATFKRIADQSQLDIRFCFFIDGLDEYNGAEEEVVKMLSFLSASNAIKICASTRPRSVYEAFFSSTARTFDIAKFTTADMMNHAQKELNENENFRRLQCTGPEREDILRLIAELAQGVWLWVFLVTRDLSIAINRYEGVDMLRKIILQFPTDLEEYFKRMINSIRPQYLEDMSQIFLIAVDELQPLPLYAFSLLEKERQDPDYAIKTPIKLIADELIWENYPAWTSHIRNRCSDLLVIDEEPLPIKFNAYLDHPVDFLHRTVRDFLQDSYYMQLRANLKLQFVSTVSLCRMCLVLLKALPSSFYKESRFRNLNIGLTDQLIYYAHETEKRDDSPEFSLINELDELGRVNTNFARGMKNHWTHARDSIRPIALDEYKEGGNCNFLALMVQARLTKYVRAKLQENSRNLHKPGRPLLDYALRPRRRTPISMPYHSHRDDPSVEISMVKLLLEYGADPNQPVYLNNGKSVWALFIISIYAWSVRLRRSTEVGISASLRNAWYQACELLIEYGARQDGVLVADVPELTIQVIWEEAFDAARSETLQKLVEENAQKKQAQKGSCLLM